MSFSQELKDFVSGFKTGASLFDSKSEREKDDAAVNLANAQAGYYSQKGALDAANNSSREEYYALRRQKLQQDIAKGADPDLSDSYNPDADPDLQFSRGGAVPSRPIKSYADGGYVDNEEDENPPAQAIPTTPQAPAPAPAAVGGAATPSQPPLPKGFAFLPAAKEAVKVGMQGLYEKYGMAPSAVPDAKKKDVKGLVMAKDAADGDQVQEVDNKIDPNRRLSDDQRNMAKLAYTYDYFVKKGQPDKAKKAAMSLLQSYRAAATRYGIISKTALEHGDINGGVAAALKAYSYIPDGREVSLQATPDGKIQYAYGDQATGKMVSKGVVTPEQMLAIVSKGAFNFDGLVQAAGEKNETASPAYAAAAQEPPAGQPLQEPNYKGMKSNEVAGAQKMYGARQKMVGTSKGRPFYPKSQADFDAVPGGAWFVNPKDGQVLRKKKTEDDAEE